MRYDEENLELVKASLNSSLEDIPALNRFQLVLDYGMFALAGLEPLSEVCDYGTVIKEKLLAFAVLYMPMQYLYEKKIQAIALEHFFGLSLNYNTAVIKVKQFEGIRRSSLKPFYGFHHGLF